jgi:predicted ATPase/DNA-binding SARP family transcriptional activator
LQEKSVTWRIKPRYCESNQDSSSHIGSSKANREKIIERDTFILRLFGAFAATLNGVPLARAWHSDRLLALLVLRRAAPTDRALLAAILWPDADEANARFYLRRTLAALRQALGTQSERLLSPTTARTLQLDLSGANCDLLAFDTARARGDLPALEEMVTLYRGPLLEGWYEDWAQHDRTVCEQQYLDTQEALARVALSRHAHDEAARALRAVLAVEPLRETAQRALLEALAASGDHAGMTQAYRDFRLLLDAQLQSQPDAETIALYRHLRAEARQKAGAVYRPVPASPTPLLGLPAQLTHLIGREFEREQIVSRLETARLLTLTGSGGVGKTRLAVAVAEEVADEYRDGVCFVDLAPLQHPAAVTQTVASALNLREAPGRPFLETLLGYLRERSLLLILDNCEHLCRACASLAEALLAHCHALRLLATSREPIGAAGERIWRVPSLSLPELTERDLPAEKGAQALLMESEAAQLFVERAAEAKASFRLTRENLDSVSEICILLDGIPLALEFAAAWVRLMPLEQIASRLRERLNLLQSHQPGRLARQQTLRETLDWSYGLLSPEEQTLLRQLSVFSGGWTLEAVEAVCAEEEDCPDSVLLRLAGLVDKSLVEYTESAGTGRYRLLETTRQYAREKLRHSGEAAGIQQQHLDYFVQLAERANTELRNVQPSAWLRLMDGDRMNFQAALALALADMPHDSTEVTDTPGAVFGNRTEMALRLCATLWSYWDNRGYLHEGRESLRRALERANAMRPTSGYAAALLGAGTLAYRLGDLAAASALFVDTAEVGRALGDAPSLCGALNSLAHLARIQGDMDRARSLFEEFLEVARSTRHLSGEAAALGGLGVVLWASDLAAARSAIEQSLDLYRRLGWRLQIATTLMNLGSTVKMQGDSEWAESLYEECLSMYRSEGTVAYLPGLYGNLGHLANDRGDYRAAVRYHGEALAIWGRNDDVGGVLWCLEGMAVALAPQGFALRAARLCGAAEALREPAGYAVTMPNGYQRCVDQLRIQLGEAVCAAAWAAGRAMTLKQAVTYALQEDDPEGLSP